MNIRFTPQSYETFTKQKFALMLLQRITLGVTCSKGEWNPANIV